MPEEEKELKKIRSIADYQLGKGAGEALFPDRVNISLSKSTGRIRHIYLDNYLLATLRPTDGMFSLTLAGANRLVKGLKHQRFLVRVQKDIEHIIELGKSVFAKHVVYAHEEIRPREEVIVVGDNGRVLAVGKSVLTGKEMQTFKHGLAIKVRRGALEEVKNI